MLTHRLILGDSENVLKSFPDNSIHLAVTSPPYFNAREYAQWQTLQDYLDDMKEIFKEVFRVLEVVQQSAKIDFVSHNDVNNTQICENFRVNFV